MHIREGLLCLTHKNSLSKSSFLTFWKADRKVLTFCSLHLTVHLLCPVSCVNLSNGNSQHKTQRQEKLGTDDTQTVRTKLSWSFLACFSTPLAFKLSGRWDAAHAFSWKPDIWMHLELYFSDDLAFYFRKMPRWKTQSTVRHYWKDIFY